VPAEFAGARVWVRAGMGESGDTYIENPLSPSKMATDDEERVPMTPKEKLYELFDDPMSSCAAVGIMVFLNVLILISTSCFIIETMPQFRGVEESTWFMLETICIAGFSLDFVVRMVCTPDCKEFWTEFMNMVDFVAIMPYYVEMAVTLVVDDAPIPQFLRVIRVVRLARVLRIIRLTKAGRMAGVIVDIAQTALNALIVPIYFMYTIIIIAGTFVYYSEKGEPVSCLAMTNNDAWVQGMAKLHPAQDRAWKDADADGVLDGNYVWDGEAFVDYVKGGLKPQGNITDPELVRYVQLLRDDLDMTHQFCSKEKMEDTLVPGADTTSEPVKAGMTKAEWYFERIFGKESADALKYQTGQNGTAVGLENTRVDSTYHCNADISTCCYCLRNDVYTDGVGYNSVPDGVWFIMVTMTTVGYGDIFPVTWAGRGVAMATMCTAVFCIAMPLTIVGTSFNIEWEDLEHQRHEVEEEALRNDVKKWMKVLKEKATDLKKSLNTFAADYQNASSKSDKLKVVQGMQKEDSPTDKTLQQKIDGLSADLGDAFELVNIGLLDM